MPYPHHPYYQDRRSVSDLCYDFPADEPLVEGLHAMQVHFVRNGVNVDIPVLRVMNTAHFLASYMFATTCSGDQLEYDVLAYMSVGHDKQMMLMTMIVLAAMLKRTDGVRASQCRNVLLEDRSEDFYEGVSLYERFITSAEERFAEQDFMTDVMARLTDLRELTEQLTNEKRELQLKIKEIENQPKVMQPIIHANNLVYNDHHIDNHQEITINTSGANVADVVRAFVKGNAEDVQAEETKSTECFSLLTEQCRKEGKVQTIEAELRTACQGTAVNLWRTIRTNEALGYIATQQLDTKEVYQSFSAYFGALPYNERNFRKARNQK